MSQLAQLQGVVGGALRLDAGADNCVGQRLAAGLCLVEHLAGRVTDLQDDHRLQFTKAGLALRLRHRDSTLAAVVGEYLVGVGQIQQRDFAAAECHRQPVPLRFAQAVDPVTMN